jgi:hypothetical protein
MSQEWSRLGPLQIAAARKLSYEPVPPAMMADMITHEEGTACDADTASRILWSIVRKGIAEQTREGFVRGTRWIRVAQSYRWG